MKKGQQVILTKTNEIGIMEDTPANITKAALVRVGNSIRAIKQTDLKVVDKAIPADTRKFPSYMAGDRVKVSMTDKSFFYASVEKASPSSESLVSIKEVKAESAVEYHKSKVALVPRTYEMMYVGKQVIANVAGSEIVCKVHTFSPATSSKVKLSVPKVGDVIISKDLVRDKPPYIAPKEYYKDFKDKTPDLDLQAKLFQATTHQEVCKLAMANRNGKYTIYSDPEYTALVPVGMKPKDKLPCLIAHTDLHPNLKHPTEDNLEFDGDIFKSATGLGADDRAGVFAIAKLLETHPGKFMVLFPDKEEVGLVGSRKFAFSKDFKHIDNHASVYISIDRRREFNGDKTIATYSCDDNTLNGWVSKLTNRKIVRGSSTDCKALSSASASQVPCFNLSCGYTGEHTKGETLRFKELLETIKDLGSILDDSRINLGTYKFKDYTTTSMYGYKNNTTNKPAAEKDKMPNYSRGFGLDGYIELDDEWFFEDDLQNLLDMYNYFTGAQYDPSTDANYIIPQLDKGDQVRLDSTMTIGNTYGGEIFTKDILEGMEDSLWEVEEVNEDGTLELSGVTNTLESSTCIPRRWVTLVTAKSPSVIK